MERSIHRARRCALRHVMVGLACVMAVGGCWSAGDEAAPAQVVASADRQEGADPELPASPEETAARDFAREYHGPASGEAAPDDGLMAQTATAGAPAAEPAAIAPRGGSAGRARAPARRPGPGYGHGTIGGVGATPPMAAQRLPQSGVLASNFVAGGGVEARLDDLLDRGVMVDGEMVRLSAFQDREPLPYPVPSEEAVAVYAELERTRLREDTDRVHLQVALVARQGEAPRRPRMDVRLVLDRSGSMAGLKWNQAIAAAHALVNKLNAGDTFGLISYSDGASLDLAPTRVGNRHAAHRAIDRLAPGGGTNIGAALDMASAHAPRRQSPSDIGLVVLVSDGRVTVGQANVNELGRTSRAMFDRSGVLTTAIGLGTDFDEETMLTIAREGSGSYHFVRRAEDISSILTDELDDRAQAVAQALRVRIELGEGVVARKVYGSRLLSEQEHAAVRATEVATDARIARELGIARTRQNEEERGLRMHLPTFKRGDQHVILMELEVPRGADVTHLAKVTLDYKDLVRNRNATAVREVSAERSGDADAVAASTQRLVKRTVLAFQAGEALQNAADALNQGDLSEALSQLSERRELLTTAADLWRDDALRRDAALLSRYERVLRGAWNGWDPGSQQTLVMAMNHFGDKRMR